MKRAGVYFFYDKDGIVDSYVPYFINGLHEVVDYIVVVVNGKLNAEGRKTLSECADDLFVRENTGFDAWAYKEAIEYIGWDQLLKFDELVLANFTIFGPIFPFKDVFERMEKTECDFWGMSVSYAKDVKEWYGISLKWKCIPEIVISNFHVYKSSVLHSFEFREHWYNLPKIKTYFESNVYHEMEISKMLTDAGFIMASADNAGFEGCCPSPSVFGAFEALLKYKVPVIRVKAFFDPNSRIDFCTNIPEKIISYLTKETNYNVNLIWDHLLRINNQYDLKTWFNWNRFLPSDYTKEISFQKKVAVFYFASCLENIDQHFGNLAAFPKETDFYFITDSEEKQMALQKLIEPYSSHFRLKYCLTEGQDFLESFLVDCRRLIADKEYDLFCFVQDKKIDEDPKRFSYVEQSFVDSCFQNVVPSVEYINNVIEMFDKEPRLGLAVPPAPKNERYYRIVNESWKSCYKIVKSFLNEMEQCVPIDPQKFPLIPYGLTFWVRPKAILPILERDWDHEDFVAVNSGKSNMSETIKHSLSLFAQAQGFYSTTIMNPTYASEELTRMTDTAYTFIDLTLKYVGSKSSLKIATRQFIGILQEAKNNTTAKNTEESVNEQTQMKKRGPVRSFLYQICPIGLWDLFRRIKCFLKREPFVEPIVKRSVFKSVIRSCMPRFFWNQLRKAKCKENGWVFVDEI